MVKPFLAGEGASIHLENSFVFRKPSINYHKAEFRFFLALGVQI